MTHSSESIVLTEISSHGVATITLNKPDLRNALDEQMILSLTEAFDKTGHNPQVRVIILKGRGKVFCAGADLNWMKRVSTYSHQENIEDALLLSGLMKSINSNPKPTVAVIQGGAFGGGIGLACACDIAIAADDAKFCLSEVRLGLVPAVISPYVNRAMGERHFRRYTLTAERFSAQEALTTGLIHHLVSLDNLDETVNHIISDLLKGSPAAITQSKNLIADIRKNEATDALERLTAEYIAKARSSSDGREGITAFLEKRQPFWMHGEEK